MNEPQANIAEFTVSELSAALKRTVEDAYGYVRVRGEVVCELRVQRDTRFLMLVVSL